MGGRNRTRLILVAWMALFTACGGGVTDPGSPPPDSPPPAERFLAVGTNGTILVSDDSGATFSSVASGTGETLRGVAADGVGHCVAGGANGTFLYSEDYGDTWHSATSPTVNPVNRVVCYGTKLFFAVGEGTDPGDAGCFFKSSNGGKSWSKSSWSLILNGVGNRNATDFVAVGHKSNGDALILWSYDTGGYWAQVGLDGGSLPAGTRVLHAVIATKLNYFVAVGLGGSIYSANGGDWSAGGSVTGYIYAAAWSAAASRLVGVGAGSAGGISKGRIYYSSSTGSSWTEVSMGTIGFLFDVASDGAGQFVGVGAGGQVVYSASDADDPDAGKTWREGSSGVTEELYGAAYVAR
jgi:photosystem II stability/assembly factor-like uncharacterized protein